MYDLIKLYDSYINIGLVNAFLCNLLSLFCVPLRRGKIHAYFHINCLTTVRFTINLCLQADHSTEQSMFPGVTE